MVGRTILSVVSAMTDKIVRPTAGSFTAIRRHASAAVVRRGNASLEAVMSLAVVLPVAVITLGIGAQICKLFYGMVATLVGWPHL